MTGRRAAIAAFALFVAVLIPIWLGGGGGPGEPWRKIPADQLDERFSGMTFFGSGPAELAESSAFGIRPGRIMYYHPNGALTTAAGWNQLAPGSWRVIDGRICHFKAPKAPSKANAPAPKAAPPEEDDCWTAYDGEGEVLLWRSAKDQWIGALSPGNQACQQGVERSGCAK